jgi:signal transduction histidine kinase/HAMP domain-containing protein
VSVNRTGLRSIGAYWRRLTLWPRLAIGVTVGFLVLFAGLSLLGIRAVDASTNRILHERLAITEELADDFDGLLEHRFADLTAFDASPSTPAVKHRLLAEIFRAAGGSFTSLYLVDRNGTVTDSLGSGAPAAGTVLAGTPYVARVLADGRRTISAPFRDPGGRPVVALVVPVSGRGALAGTLDLAGRDVTKRLDAARRLGSTGHAELVGATGIALASTEPAAALVPGEHLAFYREMLRAPQPGTANVPVTSGRSEPAGLGHERHAMAFVRLSNAPWGVALGGTESETYAPAHHLRRTLILAGGGSLAALWLLTLLGARLLVRPVRNLTKAAEQMASGDLERTVSVSVGGEIGVLAESLETMRVQLRESLETVRRWGEDLEQKVADRTAELNARNRQLAAVSAILAAANETHDLDEMLRRCLGVVIAQTGARAAAVRLSDGGHSVAAGGWSEYPADAPLTLPLRGPSGDLGVLALGSPPPEEERPILTAICDQIAVAVENTRLASELRRLEAQHEVQRMRTELIAAVSHELRTPLGFIKSYSTTLLREDTPIEPATRRHFLEIIDEETEKLEHMIGELLDASRLQSGRLPIDRKPVALGALLGHVIDRARPSLEANGHTVTLGLPDEDVTVLADALRIEQVLDNLLENASRYSDPDSPVEVDLLAENGDAVVSVTDRGDSLPPAEFEQVFEPFYRGHNARNRGLRGAGLGLAICRGIVDAHDGKIWAEAGPGRATTFVVTLPIAGEPQGT